MLCLTVVLRCKIDCISILFDPCAAKSFLILAFWQCLLAILPCLKLWTSQNFHSHEINNQVWKTRTYLKFEGNLNAHSKGMVASMSLKFCMGTTTYSYLTKTDTWCVSYRFAKISWTAIEASLTCLPCWIIWQFSRVPQMIPPVHVCIWKEVSGIVHLCDFLVNELAQNRDTG